MVRMWSNWNSPYIAGRKSKILKDKLGNNLPVDFLFMGIFPPRFVNSLGFSDTLLSVYALSPRYLGIGKCPEIKLNG